MVLGVGTLDGDASFVLLCLSSGCGVSVLSE